MYVLILYENESRGIYSNEIKCNWIMRWLAAWFEESRMNLYL